MNYKKLKSHTVALATLGVLGVGALLQPAPAHASSKEKLYKGGAVALGVLGAYYIVKGKTVPGAIAGAGAYYAYKKGQDENDKNDNDYRDNRNRDNRRNNRNNNNNYRNDYSRNDNRSNDRYPDYSRNDNRNNNNRNNNRYPDYSLH